MADNIFMAIATVLTFAVIGSLSGAITDGRDVTALARNMYYEARNSTIEDQIATAVVVMNRGKPYEEVYKPHQFSWTEEYAKPADNLAYRRCQAIAKMVYNNHDAFKKKTICKHYYAANSKEPAWAKDFSRRTQIGKHIYLCK